MRNSVDSRFVILVSIFLMVLPFGWVPGINLLLALIVLNSIFGLKGKQWLSAIKSKMFIASALFFLFHVLSLLWSINPDEGLVQLGIKMPFFLAPLVLLANRHSRLVERKDHILKAFLLGSLLVSISALAVASYQSFNAGTPYFLLDDGVSKVSFFTYETLAEPFMHPGYLSVYIGMAVIISLYFTLKTSGRQRWIYIVLMAFFFLMMVLLQGRINMLGLLMVLAVGALITAIRQRNFKWLVLPMMPVILLVGFIGFASPSIAERYLQFPDFSYDISGNDFNSATYRLAEWACASDVISQNPMVGTGVGANHEALLDAYKERGFWSGLEHRYNAHNQYVETTIALGFIGLLLLLYMIFTYARLQLQQGDFVALACLAFFAFSMLTESMFERSTAILLFSCFFPLMYSLQSSGASGDVE